MELALTFGSLGDIIQLSQLAIQLGRAVGVAGAGSGESAREYQDLRQDLDLFVRILMQASKTVVATYQQHEVTPYLQELDAVSKTVVDNCTTLIQDALNHMQARYGSSLTKEGSGNKAVDVMKRVEWCMREKTRLGALRAAIQQNTQRLLLLSKLSASKSARVDNATLLARIDQVQQICQTNHQQVLQRLAEQHEKSIEPPAESLSLIKRQLDATETTSRTSMSMIGDVLQGVLQIKNLVFSLSKTVVNLQIMASHTHCMHGLDPTKELPVILEDALGRPLEIPAQWLDTLEWNALNVLLVGYFRGKKGRDMVQRRQYILEDGSSGKDINFDVPPSQSLRCGMKIYMSMAFIKRNIIVGVCPRCYGVTDATEGLNIKCSTSYCGMRFRIQKMGTELSSRLTSKYSHDATAEQTTLVSNIPAEPADFQRVRILHDEEWPITTISQIFDTALASTSSIFRNGNPCAYVGPFLWDNEAQ